MLLRKQNHIDPVSIGQHTKNSCFTGNCLGKACVLMLLEVEQQETKTAQLKNSQCTDPQSPGPLYFPPISASSRCFHISHSTLISLFFPQSPKSSSPELCHSAQPACQTQGACNVPSMVMDPPTASAQTHRIRLQHKFQGSLGKERPLTWIFSQF